jgi:hypothetical protein
VKNLVILATILTTSMAPVPDELIRRHQCRPVESVSCVVDLGLICPPGYLDGCLSNKTNLHRCIPEGRGPSCDLPMKLVCPKHFIDGCDSGETSTHLCVPQKKTLCLKSHKPLICPSGFEDSCGQ